MSQLLEEILSRDNMIRAYKRVVANKGASGVDGITTDEVKQYLIEHWEEIREQIRSRKYKPQPVRRVEIPKPNGGVRNLGTLKLQYCGHLMRRADSLESP